MYHGMIVEMVSIAGHNGDKISAYTARPEGKGPFPGIVLVHHNPGWDEIYCEFARKFAHHGYAAISHNLFQRAGEGKSDDVAAKVRALSVKAFEALSCESLARVDFFVCEDGSVLVN